MIVTKEALRRWIDGATAVKVWVQWGDDADGTWLPVDKATARLMLYGADGTFEVQTNALGIIHIAHHPTPPERG